MEVKSLIAESFYSLPQKLNKINAWGTSTFDSLLALRSLEPVDSSEQLRLQQQEDEQCVASSTANAASRTSESRFALFWLTSHLTCTACSALPIV